MERDGAAARLRLPRRSAGMGKEELLPGKTDPARREVAGIEEVEQLGDQENADLATLRTTALPVESSETKTDLVRRLHAARTAFACSLLAVFPHHPSYQQPHQQEERCDYRYLIHKPSGGSDSIACDLHSDWITVHLKLS